MQLEEKMVRILFEPQGLQLEVPLGRNLLAAAREHGIFLQAYCGGNGSCGKCQVRLIHADLSETEELACQVSVTEDVRVEFISLPVSDQVILTEREKREKTGQKNLPLTGVCASYGAAIDIGTTTLAAYLFRMDTRQEIAMASAMNPQIPYGDDVISRIAYCEKNETGLETLKNLIRQAIEALIEELAGLAGICREEITELSLVGNTVMEHILLGLSPACLGHAPFRPQVKKRLTLSAKELGLVLGADGLVHILPAVDGFVGADHLAVLLSQDPRSYPGTTLVVDIGTNTEICLHTEGRMYVTTCATGPAFEGAQIKNGMRAARGAIDHVVINPVSLEPKLGIIGGKGQTPRGICGSGILDAVAEMKSVGILRMDGTFSPYARSERICLTEDGDMEYRLTEDISITQADVRAVQMAKAALYAGIRMLFRRSGVKAVDRIFLAGGFGCRLDGVNALKLGLFPDCDPAQIISVGNAAGDGAALSLLYQEKRAQADELAELISFVETASDPAFEMTYADAMALPHRRDSFIISSPHQYGCPGEDRRFLPEEVYCQDFDILTDSKKLLAMAERIRRENAERSLILPIVQNQEAASYGAEIKKMKGCWAPGSYPYKELSEISDLSRSLLDDPGMQALLGAVKVSEKTVILETEAPFSILSALVKPEKIYAALRRNPKLVEELLIKIAEDQAKYLEQAVRAGCRVISLADPTGSANLCGPKIYRQVIMPSQIYLLKKCRRFLKKGIIHLCGRASSDLVNAGAVSLHAVRIESFDSYEQALFHLAEDSKIRFMGNGCMRFAGNHQTLAWIMELLI